MLRKKSPDQLSPYEAVLRYFGYLERASPQEHAKARDALERAVENAPDQSSCWATLAMVYRDEHTHGFNVRPDPLGRALAAAHRAVEAAPSNHLAHHALASALFFRREIVAFRSAAERTLALNPMDSSTTAYLGTLMAHEGDWERACALVERARQLNPNHPGWYWFVAFWDAYRKRDYRGALAVALKINMPGDFYVSAVIAAAYGQLGELEAARTALLQLLAMKPDFAATAREDCEKWFGAGELVEHFLDGLRKAGLEIADEAGPSAAATASDSGAVRADEGFWVAVLPFKYSGNVAELAALAEGLTEDIVTGLSRFSYLRVIARSSTSGSAAEGADFRAAGKALGARYLMEGSVRQAGTKLRLAVQVVDATTGAHLWAENYERAFTPENVFELQDALVPRIVSTVADSNGILARSMSEAVRSRDPEQLTPYEAVLRSFGYGQRVTPEELGAARSALESAVRKAPAYADAWAMLSWLHVQDYAQGFNLQSDSLASGLAAAQRAVESAPSNALAYFSLAPALFFQREFQSFRNAADRAVALNPMDGNSIAFMGELLTYAGEWERGLELAGRAKELNPNYPGWYWYADFYDAYRRGDYRGALGFALKINLPGQWFSHASKAAALGQLGERDAAAKAVQVLLRVRPDFADTAKADIEKWWDPEYVDSMIDGWRKAGLDITVPKPGTTAPAAAPEDVAIAVLPFSDMSAAKDPEYLCEGMAEEIRNALVRVGGIRVASRTSTFQARRHGADLPAIGKVLAVGQVLEGSVRTAGDRLRVTAQLTDVASGFQLWSERFDRKAEDVFAVQDDITMGVVDAVKARLSPGERAVRARPQPVNVEAYRSYLKGRHLRAKEDHPGALRAFEDAVRLDPSHAPSWTGLAEITVLASVFGVIPARDACATAREALATATRLQGESSEGWHVEGFVAWIERRWAAMETAWRRAIELEPTNVLALASFGIVLCSRQRLDEALPFLERARNADPLSSFPYALTGKGILNCGRPQEGLRYLEDALSFDKEDATALDSAGLAHVALGHLEEGIATLESVVEITHRGAHFLGSLGWALATAGRQAEARTILEELRARPTGSPTVVSEAWLLGALGEIDAAFDVVARAEEEYLAFLYFTGEPGFDPIRADPRFVALLERLGLPSLG
jgi:TolB-like protein/Tfp pilus assembly protein PilF